MPRVNALLSSIVIVALLGVIGSVAQPPAVAREATPGPVMESPGVSFEPIAITSGLQLQGSTDLIVVRMRLEPGATLPLDVNDPQAGMVVVESGAFTVRVDAPWAVARAGRLNAALATAEATGTFTPSDEAVAGGQETTMTAGDAAYIPGGISGEIRNDGQEPAVALVLLLGPTETMTGATPAP